MYSKIAKKSFNTITPIMTEIPKGFSPVPSTSLITTYDKIKPALKPYNTQLMSHPIYNSIQTLEQCQFFMENHAFAVWDFMSLLKALQLKLTCLTLPWVPPKNPELAYFINSIVMGEETDDLGTHHYSKATSHYDLYLSSMKEVGSNTEPVSFFVGNLQNGLTWREALTKTRTKYSYLPVNTFEFVEYTLNVVEEGTVPEIAASFLFGREDPIPLMFQKLLDHFQKRDIFCPNLKLYLQRHIDVDGDHHGPMADLALGKLCTDEEKCQKAFDVARESIQMRMHLWDGIYSKIK